MAEPVIPPPPPGFTLDAVPPPPPGFTLDSAPKKYGAADVLFAPDAAASLASGMVSAPLSGLAGIAGAVLPGPAGQGADWQQKVQDATTYQPRTRLGQETVQATQAPFEALANVGQGAGNKVLDATGSPMLATAVDTLIQGLPLVAGRFASPKISRARVLADTEADVRQRLNAPKDAVIDYAKDKGLGISPAEANPSLLNRIAEGFSGQAQVQLLQSAKNQPTFNNIVRGAFGIAKDTPLSIDVLANVRKVYGKAYEAVRNLGEIPIDAEYVAALDKIESKYQGASKSFKNAENPVQEAVKTARETVTGNSFDSSAALDQMKIERAAADKAFAQRDTELGKAHKSIADAIEEQIDRHVEKLNAQGLFTPDVMGSLKQARQVIAQSYDVQKALKGENVDVRLLASQLKKGKLSGDLKDLGRFGQEFPKSSQVSANAPVIGGFGDTGMGALGGIGAMTGFISGHPTTGGIAATTAALSRPAIRAAITSKVLNPAMVKNSYAPSSMLTLGDALTSDPALFGLASQLPSVDAKR